MTSVHPPVEAATIAGRVSSDEELRRLHPPTSLRASRKDLDRLDRHCVRFIGLSPFCVLGTVDGDGMPDTSPRGGDPGFVRVVDARTVVLPDRPGNYRLDSVANVVGQELVSLLFLVPGIDETLRVFGRASVVVLDDARRQDLGLDAKGTTALHIEVTKAYFHCAKAVMRSGLWDPDRQVERSVFPTMGELMNEHSGLTTVVETQAEMLVRYEPTL